ncbi:ATP-binding protein [uncultured Rhodoblastus sp.]|uniref:ATP-binding protein n=1 Tax=uncultured Rhodoblastus sp. TaxID=543037 RepID=UPI0025DA8731|nr:ATP-binding protein [uncultured Rhodoblastus sp.]
MNDIDTAKNNATRAIMKALRMKYIASPRDAELQKALDYIIYRATHLAMPIQAADDEIDNDFDDDYEDDFDDESYFVEGRALAVLGHSGAGKSTALARILAAKFPDYGKPSCLVVYVTAPAPCTLKTLGRKILHRLGYPLVADRKEHEVWEAVRLHLAKIGTRILIIDEMQNITSNAKSDEVARIRDTLKSLLNSEEHPICLVFAGLPELQYFLEADTQIRRRTRFVEFKSLSESDLGAAKGTVNALAKSAGLTTDFGDHLGQRLIHAALCEFGTLIDMTLEAIEHALKSGANALNSEDYATAFALRTGNTAPANPFATDAWRQIDCSFVLMDDPRERDQPIENSRGAKNTGRRKS